MARIIVMPDATHLKEGIRGTILYAEQVKATCEVIPCLAIGDDAFVGLVVSGSGCCAPRHFHEAF